MLTQFSHKSNHCCCIFRAFGPVLSQFSHVQKIAATLVDQCCCSFRTTRVCAKIAKHWWTSLVAVFAQTRFCAKIATTLVDQSCRSFRTCENCSNTGGPVLLQFSHNPGLCENCETLVDQSYRSFRANQVLRENCNNTGGPVLLQFSHNRGLRESCETLVDQSRCNFHAKRVRVKIATQNGSRARFEGGVGIY